MLDSELFQNYVNACYYYAYTNATNTLPYEGFVLALDPGVGTAASIEITQWDHFTPQPTYDDLVALDLESVQDVTELRSRNKERQNLSSWTTYLTGPWSGSHTFDVEYRVSGPQVVLCFPDVDVTGNNSSAHITSTTQLPRNIRPGMNMNWSVIVNNNDSKTSGKLCLNTSGVLMFCSDAAASPFSSGTGQFGIEASTVSYFL